LFKRNEQTVIVYVHIHDVCSNSWPCS